ncbi:MAG: rhodanese-like domain-containing protein [Chitinophagaceae bacterium]
MGIFSFLGLGNGKLKAALKKGAVVIDVRTVHEYDQGRIPGSLNIPLERIPASIGRIRGLDKPVICCCNSGSRSGKAVQILKENGLKEVYNGGGWTRLIRLVKST